MTHCCSTAREPQRSRHLSLPQTELESRSFRILLTPLLWPVRGAQATLVCSRLLHTVLQLLIDRCPDWVPYPLRSCPQKPSPQFLQTNQPLGYSLPNRSLHRCFHVVGLYDSEQNRHNGLHLAPRSRCVCSADQLDDYLHHLPAILLRVEATGNFSQGTPLGRAFPALCGVDEFDWVFDHFTDRWLHNLHA